MATFTFIDGDGDEKFVEVDGSGSPGDPYRLKGTNAAAVLAALQAIQAKTDNLDTALSGVKTGTDKIIAAPATAANQTATNALIGEVQTSPTANTLLDRLKQLYTAITGTLTVATHAVTQSGTWTVQPGNTANTTAWKVDGSAVTQPVSNASLPLPSGASTAANQTTANTSLSSIDGKLPATLGQKTMAASAAVVIASDQSNVPTKETRSSTSTTTNVASSATNVTLLASNAARLGFGIFNDSVSDLYLKYGTTASTTSFTVIINANSYYEDRWNHTGRIDGIWLSATGNARITELS
jgi:hypothetical protein